MMCITYNCERILATVQVFLLLASGVLSIRARRYVLFATNQRASADILRSTNVMSVTSWGVFCLNTDACDAFNVRQAAADGAQTCEAVRLTSTANIASQPLWRVFAGKALIQYCNCLLYTRQA